MFTSNGEVYCKLFSNTPDSGIVELVGSYCGANQAYDEKISRKAHAPPMLNAQTNNGNCFNQRVPLHIGGNVKLKEPEKDLDQEHRKVHFRNGGQNMYCKDALELNSSNNNGIALHEDSSSTSDCGYGGPSKITKVPQSYLKTQLELKTPPKFKVIPNLKTPPDLRTPSELKSAPQYLPTLGLSKAPLDFIKNHIHGERQSHGNHLLNLRAALSEKELQLVELREQHLNVLNRAADARYNWEEALQEKDRVILQLHRKLQQQESQLDRQDRENQENLYARRKRQEENSGVEKIQLKVALVEAKNAQYVQELVEQQKLITKMKRHIDEQEKLCTHQCRKLERVNGKFQDLKAALHKKEEVADTQSKYSNELKTLLWKRDSIIAELQLSEQQLQSALAREKADREALSLSREKVQEEKDLIEKRLFEMENQHRIVGHDTSSKVHLQRGHRQSDTRKLTKLKDNFNNVQDGVLKDIDNKEGIMHRMQKRIRELQRSLKNKDIALSERNNEYQQALQDFQRLAEDFEALKQEYEEINQRNFDLENTVSHLQEYSDGQMDASTSEVWTPPVEVLPYGCSLGGSIGEDLGVDDTMLDSMEFDLEQLSNASVYHANFEKIKISEVEMPEIDPQQQKQGNIFELNHDPSCPPPPPPSPPPPPLNPLREFNATSLQCPPLVAPQQSSPIPSANLVDKNSEGQSLEFEAKHSSIQDEIMKREQSWRKTEELMRAALTRRMKLLELARDDNTPKNDDTIRCAKTRSKFLDKNGFLHHQEAESSIRGKIDHKQECNEGHHLHLCRNPIDDDNKLNNHFLHRKVYGHKPHAHDGARCQRQTLEQDIYQEDCRMNHNMGLSKKFGVNNKQHEHAIYSEQRKNIGAKNNHLDGCTIRSEHYGHFEHTGHQRESVSKRKGRIP